jgi:hypothetical protein
MLLRWRSTYFLDNDIFSPKELIIWDFPFHLAIRQSSRLSQLENKKGEKPCASLPLIITAATATPLISHVSPIAYISYPLTMLPIFSEIPFAPA